MRDVVVVGGGPAGAAAAKRCAERGLDTLLLEKKRLPRDKVCTGLLLGRLAHRMVAEVFGPLPDDVVLTRLKGVCLWMPGVGDRRIFSDTPLTWRKDLDHWMVRHAEAAGAEVWEDALVRGIDWGDGGIPGAGAGDPGAALSIRREGTEQTVAARWIIAADGAYSTVRRALFPDAGFGTSAAYREWYRGASGLDDEWVYVTFPRGEYRPNVWICPKDDGFTLEGAGVKPLKDDIRGLLEEAGWEQTEPTWRDGCVSRAVLFEHLTAGRFTPALGNTLLVGDAAGLQLPIGGEGIGTAIESALLAAEAVAAAAVDGAADAATDYLEALRPLLSTLAECYEEVAHVRALSGEALLDALHEGFARSFEID